MTTTRSKVSSADFPLGIDLTDPVTFADGIPHDAFARLRREAPVVWHPERSGPGFWSVTRHADVVDVNRDTRTMSSALRGNMIFDTNDPAEPDVPRMLVHMDPPQHTRYRRLVNRGFTPRMIARLEESMREVTTSTLDRVVDRGEAELVEEVAAELPIQIITRLMGVPDEDRARVFGLSNRLIGFDDPEYGDKEAANAAGFEMYSIANRLGKEKRALIDAGERPDDIVTALLEAEVDGDQLSELEYDMFFLLLTVAGNETTRTAIAQGMLAFMANPEQWERVRDDRSLLATAVDEILRYTTPIMNFRRTVTEAREIGSQPVSDGDKVVIWYASANFDDEVFDDPLRFDVGRTPNEHVTFGGGGPHFCLGANLARLELRVMYDQLLDRLPLPELAGPVERLHSNFNHGLKRVPIRWG
jgi:cholest-4-en-3-one 26-monooxygenase